MQKDTTVNDATKESLSSKDWVKNHTERAGAANVMKSNAAAKFAQPLLPRPLRWHHTNSAQVFIVLNKQNC